MNIVVTGATGRIGGAVCRHLHAAGHAVAGVDQTYRTDLPVPLSVANLLDREACYPLLKGADTLVHLANHPDFVGGNAQRIFLENVTMDMNVFQAAAELGVRSIVFASSVQAFSHLEGPEKPGRPVPAYLPLDGDMPPNPGNPYALSKVCGEQMLRYFVAEYDGMAATALRFPFVVTPQWIPKLKGRWRRVTGARDGYSFIHVDDAASVIGAVIAARLPPGYRCYLPAAREPLAADKGVRDLLAESYASTPLRRPAAEITSLVDLSALKRDLGWEPAINSLP